MVIFLTTRHSFVYTDFYIVFYVFYVFSVKVGCSNYSEYMVILIIDRDV